jgi:hypothetical protein
MHARYRWNRCKEVICRALLEAFKAMRTNISWWFASISTAMLGSPRRPEIVSTGSAPGYQAAAEAVKRAILLSQRFDMLSPSAYDTWKDMEIKFAPNELKRQPNPLLSKWWTTAANSDRILQGLRA